MGLLSDTKPRFQLVGPRLTMAPGRCVPIGPQNNRPAPTWAETNDPTGPSAEEDRADPAMSEPPVGIEPTTYSLRERKGPQVRAKGP
jgi:hypothetical protein